MSDNRINKIVIVGGGSSGWMTAAHLINDFPEKEIVVVESPDYPTVGVGESTLQYIRPWIHHLGLKDEDWMDACDATYKVSVRFENWDGKGGHFHYPFGRCMVDDDIALDYYNFGRLVDNAPPEEWAEVLFPAALMAENNYLIDKMHGWDLHQNSAFHFDAIKFAQYLKHKYALPRGVKLIEDTIIGVDHEPHGITKLHGTREDTRNDQAITADLFIDCTGWKGMLIDAVGSKFRDYSYGLVNNCAYAFQIPEVKPNQFYTNCVALESGWAWDTPVQNRTGTGYVFSDKFVSHDEALEQYARHLGLPLKELNPKFLTWRQGRREMGACKNVVAIGLSSGFIEPLESNGLFTTHESLKELSKSLQRGTFCGAEVEGYNYAVGQRFDDFADFVLMHYQYSTRMDTPYWRAVKSRKLNNNNANYEFYASTYRDSRTLSGNAHYNSVALGQGFNPVSMYDASFETLYEGVDMITTGKAVRADLLKRKEMWLEGMEKHAINR